MAQLRVATGKPSWPSRRHPSSACVGSANLHKMVHRPCPDRRRERPCARLVRDNGSRAPWTPATAPRPELQWARGSRSRISRSPTTRGRERRTPSRASAWMYRPAASSRSSARRAAANPACSTPSPGSSYRAPVACWSTACRCAVPAPTAPSCISNRQRCSPGQCSDNVAPPLRARKLPREQCRDIVARYLELVGLADFARHAIYEISGGMQQRVALARALAANRRSSCSMSRSARSTRCSVSSCRTSCSTSGARRGGPSS